MQFDEEDRGFSIMNDGPLDMRMDKTTSLTAKDLVNDMSEKELGVMFKDLGEERLWRKAAKAISETRQKKEIKTTKELKDVVESVIPRRGKTHPATKIFQALRMYLNKELESIEESILKAFKTVSPKGRITIISFHSLEDRLVKNLFKKIAEDTKDFRGMTVEKSKFKVVTKKPIACSKREMRRNRRARSAKVRVVERKEL